MVDSTPTVFARPSVVAVSRVAFFVIASAAAGACGGPDAMEGAGAAVVPVRVREVARVDRPASVDLSGDVEALRTANLGFLVPGQVESVGAKEGDRVTEGQVLAALDPADYEFNLELAAAQRERAEDEYARAQQVFAQQGIPENDLHKAATAVRMARAQEGMAEKKLSDSRVTSPFSGVLARRQIEPGEQAGPGLSVFTVVSVDPVQVRVGVPENEIGRIAVGQRATVSIPALDGATFEGRVRLVGIAADPASRTYTAKIEVANPRHVLRPGMIAEVRVETDARVRALTLPGEAVVRDADGITRVFVYFPDEGRVHSRRVDVGSAYGTEIEISDGLTGDEMVVIGGQHRLREGSSVEATVAAPGVPAADSASATQ